MVVYHVYLSIPLRRRRCGCAARRAGTSWWATTRRGRTPGRAATRTSCRTAELRGSGRLKGQAELIPGETGGLHWK
eukprot:scaffold12330_cov57-Phaeocystis_antarctica.AAC.1